MLKLNLTLVLVCITAGCFQGADSEALKNSRRYLQTGQDQKAIDSLSSEESISGHYLRSVALDRLQRKDAAVREIEQALEQDTENQKYLAYRLRMNLYAGDEEAAREIINLRNTHLSSGALALSAFYAYQGKAVRHAALNQISAARQAKSAGFESLKTAVTLNAEIPEFHLEMLSLVVTFKLQDEAALLVDKLDDLMGDDSGWLLQRREAYLLTERFDDAIQTAADIYESSNRSEHNAVLYATTLTRSPANKRRDQLFQDLVKRYPDNAEMLTKYVIYLGKSNRLTSAIKILNDAIAEQPDKKIQQILIYVAIDLPIEQKAVKLAEAQLRKYRSRIPEPLLVQYFEGRILFLQGQKQKALDVLAGIVNSQRKNDSGNRPLAAEALRAIRFIIADGSVDKKLQNATQAISQVLQPDGKKKEVIIPDKSSKQDEKQK